jgi:hypothetical protein
MKKMRTRLRILFIAALVVWPALSGRAQELRSYTELFPGITAEQRSSALSSAGYLYSGAARENLTLAPRTGGNITITKTAPGRNPGFFVEALRIIPRRQVSLLKIYNALGQIRALKGKLYHSAGKDRYVPLFEDAVRVEGPRQIRSLLPDPPPASRLPIRETMYVRLTDANFGHCYYTISLSTNLRGILCEIVNFKSVTFGPIPVMRENTFTALLYIEPVQEGLVLYCLAGAEVSNFIAKHVNIPSALNKRLDVIVGWMLDGIR